MQGSPPLTRGTPHLFNFSASLAGITPAYAGNTEALKEDFANMEDHPRLRGEHLQTFRQPHILLGSPPLTRGTLESTLCNFSPVRITPAYAGNTPNIPYKV